MTGSFQAGILAALGHGGAQGPVVFTLGSTRQASHSADEIQHHARRLIDAVKHRILANWDAVVVLGQQLRVDGHDMAIRKNFADAPRSNCPSGLISSTVTPFLGQPRWHQRRVLLCRSGWAIQKCGRACWRCWPSGRRRRLSATSAPAVIRAINPICAIACFNSNRLEHPDGMAPLPKCWHLAAGGLCLQISPSA